jgi:hypothetical protein
MRSTDRKNVEGKVMENKHTKMRWGSEMALLQRQRAERRAKSKAQIPREIKVNLAKEVVSLTMGQPAFKTKTEWVNDDAGLLTVVVTMMDESILPPVNVVIRKTGSVPNRVAHTPKASVGRPIGGLPELMAEAMKLDAALPPHAKGTAILSCLSDDDIDQMVAGLYGNRLTEEQQSWFDQAVAAAYNISQQGVDVKQIHRPEVIMFDEKNRPAWIRLTPTSSLVLTSTGLAGGGKDTAAMGRRRVTGPSSTNEHLTASAWQALEHAKTISNGLELGLVASHGGTSKDALVAYHDQLDASSAPIGGGHQFLLSTPFKNFARAEQPDVGLEMMSTIGLVGFTPRPTPPEGGWHVTFVEEDHQAMKAMDLFMLEQALIDYLKLSPSHKDRTDHRNILLSWSRDLGRGCGLTGILGDEIQGPICQQADFWLLSGASITNHRLNNSIQQSHLEESVVSQLRTLVSGSLATTSTGTNHAFQPDRIQHARRCIKAVMLKLYIPENHEFTTKQLEHLRIAFHNAAYAAFDLSSSVYAIPKIEVAIIALPKAALSSPFLSVHCLTHARDLIRSILADTQEGLDEMTPHGLRKISESRFNVSQLSRRRVDAMIKALQKQEQSRTMDGWLAFWRRVRKKLFIMAGRQPKIDPAAFDN